MNIFKSEISPNLEMKNITLGYSTVYLFKFERVNLIRFLCVTVNIYRICRLLNKNNYLINLILNVTKYSF